MGPLGCSLFLSPVSSSGSFSLFPHPLCPTHTKVLFLMHNSAASQHFFQNHDCLPPQ